MMVDINKVLLNNCRKGKQSAQYEGYQILYSESLKIAMRYTCCTAEAKDVLNKSFLKVFTKIDQINGDGYNFFGWVKRILINQALNKMKSSSFRNSFELIEATHHFQVSNNIQEYYDYENVIQLIQKLPPTSACLFNLYAIEGYTHKQIGTLLGMTMTNSR